jgi:hypothetical protein
MDDDPPIRHNPSPGAHIHWGQSNIFFSNRHNPETKSLACKPSHSPKVARNMVQRDSMADGRLFDNADHIHAFCAPRDLNFTIEAWIAYWKREFSLKHQRKDWKFQSRGWHHRIRDGENHSDKWRYIQENPVRKGLAKNIEDWPFKGRVFDLMWTGR